MYYFKQNQGAKIYLFSSFSIFFPFSISHSNVMTMEIFVKDSQELLELEF